MWRIFHTEVARTKKTLSKITLLYEAKTQKYVKVEQKKKIFLPSVAKKKIRKFISRKRVEMDKYVRDHTWQI